MKSKMSGRVLILILCVTLFANVSESKIYLIGDSTVYTYNSSYYPMAGWGQMLQYFLNKDSITVVNKAIGGRSSKSFYNDHWSYVRDVLQPGDYVFVQFGINDANSSDPARYAPPWTTFQDYLKLFVEETQAKGATCALVATLRRNSWNATNPPTMYDAYHDYPVSTRALAQELNVPLIDLDQACKSLMEPLGPLYTGPFMYMNLDEGVYSNYPGGLADNVHFQEMGAIEMARLVVEEMATLGDFPEMAKLIPYINPVYEIAVSSNMPDAGLVTRTASYPEGLTITLKTNPNLGYEFVEWQDTEGNRKSVNNLFRFRINTSPAAYHAILEKAHSEITIQEEEIGFCGVDGSVDSTYSGFTGSGYANTDDAAGVGVDWQIEVGVGGKHTFEWRYANGSSDCSAKLCINGLTVPSLEINFPATGDWTNWSTVTLDFNLAAGMEEIRLEAIGDAGLPNIDYMKVSGSIVKPGVCGSQGIISGGIYQIVNKASGKVLEVANASTSNAANVQQGTNSGGEHQQWEAIENTSGYYNLKAQHSSQFMDVNAKSTASGANIIQYPSNGGTNQDWSIEDMGENWFKITARHSGLCLEVENGSTADGANVQQATDVASDAQRWQFVLISSPNVGVEAEDTELPEEFSLEQNFPNPFNPLTEIRYNLKETGSVRLAVYNILGREIKTLVQMNQTAGAHNALWNGTDESGKLVSSGIYFYSLEVNNPNGSVKRTKKMLLTK